MIAFSVVKGVRKRCLRMCALIRAYILCRMWHVNRGRGVAFFGKTILRAYSKNAISLGDNVTVLSKTSYNLVGLTNPSIICACAGARIKIGSYTGLSSTVIHARNSVTIGDYVKIGGNVRIFDHDFHSLDWEDRRPPETASSKTRPVIIGNDVFIGTNAIILKGTHIGDRSVVAAGSVVFGLEVPPDSIVKGNPARVLSRRLANSKSNG